MTALELDLLQAFVAVADQRSFTRAASVLNRTQSAVSTQVKRLEQRLSAELFHRTTAHVELSPVGEGLLGYARRMLDLNEEALGRVRQHKVTGIVRLGVMEDYGVLFVPALLVRFAAAHPLVQVEMETGLTGLMLERLGADLDIVIAMHPVSGEGGGMLLRQEQVVWACGPNFPEMPTHPLPLALYPSGCLFRRWATEALDAAGRPWRLAFVGQGLAAVAAVAAEGLAVTVVKAGTLPRSLVSVSREHGLPPLPKADIRLHRAPVASPAVILLADHLVRHLSDPLPLPRRNAA
jgi:DNA-binding transcriptional LysR family regulator